MIDTSSTINKATKILLAELSQRDGVLGVIMFGSWARGNPRPNSDVDLMVIYSGEYQKSIEDRDGQVFEIIYTNEIEVIKFWESHLDDAVDFWAVAKVLFDKSGRIKALKDKIKPNLDAGKKSLTIKQLKQLHFDAQDQLNYVASNIDTEPITANFILTNQIFKLTEIYFDIRRLWTPAPKQRLSQIKQIDPNFYNLLEQFYQENKTLKNRLNLSNEIVQVVFENFEFLTI